MPKASRKPGSQLTKKTVPRSYQQFSDEKKAEIAYRRFEPLSRGEKAMTNQELADEYGGSPGNFKNIIADAFRKGLVEIRKVFKPVGKVEQDRVLQRKLMDAFPSVNTTLVVKIPKDIAVDDEMVHKMIGYKTAKVLENGTSLSDCSTFCVGSGRGVFFTISSLRSLGPFQKRNLNIWSLSGAVYPSAVEDSFSIPLDADNHMAILSTCFLGGANVNPISHPIAPDVVETVRPNTWLGQKDKIDQLKDACALVGVGMLGPGHRFYDAVENNKRCGRNHVLDAIFEELGELVKLAKDYTVKEHNYSPVGDLASCLFFIPPPDQIRITEKDQKRIRILIESINEQTLTVSWEQLQQIKALTLIAGTPGKARALNYLLHSDMNIQWLCTDNDTALALLTMNGVL